MKTERLELNTTSLYNQTVIIITHDERIALSADRVITIEDGQITRDEARIKTTDFDDEEKAEVRA